jgi:hypothetical protein
MATVKITRKRDLPQVGDTINLESGGQRIIVREDIGEERYTVIDPMDGWLSSERFESIEKLMKRYEPLVGINFIQEVFVKVEVGDTLVLGCKMGERLIVIGMADHYAIDINKAHMSLKRETVQGIVDYYQQAWGIIEVKKGER